MLYTILLAPRFILEAAGHSARLRRSRRLLVGRRDRWYRSRPSERLLLPFDLFWGHPERSFLADLRKGLLFVFFPAVRTRRIQLLQNRQQFRLRIRIEILRPLHGAGISPHRVFQQDGNQLNHLLSWQFVPVQLNHLLETALCVSTLFVYGIRQSEQLSPFRQVL